MDDASQNASTYSVTDTDSWFAADNPLLHGNHAVATDQSDDSPVLFIFVPVNYVSAVQTVMQRIDTPYRINDDAFSAWKHKQPVCFLQREQLSTAQRIILANAQVQGADVQPLFYYLEQHLERIEVDLLNPRYLLTMEPAFSATTWMTWQRKMLRRAIDVSVALIGFLLFFLPGLLVALWIRLDSKGPVFFLQKRIGLYNKEFSIIKFRSMHINAERHGACWASKNDARVTRAGRFMRQTRIDEVPQLLNVLKGDMALIGPRPERAVFVRRLEGKIPFYHFRHLVKPGITGLAQVMFCYGASIEDAREKHRYDLYYIKHCNWRLDMKILRKTLKTVLSGDGV